VKPGVQSCDCGSETEKPSIKGFLYRLNANIIRSSQLFISSSYNFPVLKTRIFHKGRRERPENAMNARNSAKRSADILKYFEESFLRCDEVVMVFSGLAADRLWNLWVINNGQM